MNDEGAEQIGAKDKESNTGGADLQPISIAPHSKAQDGSRDLKTIRRKSSTENSLCSFKNCDTMYINRVFLLKT